MIPFLYPEMVVYFWWKIERCSTSFYISTLGKVMAISKLDMPLFDSVYGLWYTNLVQIDCKWIREFMSLCLKLDPK